MARRTQTYAIRLAVEGGGQVKAELVSVGQSGEQSLKRIETAGERASGGLKGLGRQAELLRTGIRTLGGALIGRGDGRRPRRPGRSLDLGGQCHRQDRRHDRGWRRGAAGAALRRQSVGRRAADARHGAAALHPARRRGGAGHGRGEGRAGADGHRAARPERQPAQRARTCSADVADAFARIEDPAERVRLAFKLFDSEGVALVNLLRGGSGALEEMRERARDLGIVLDEHLVRDAERARTELDTLSQVISANLTRAALEAAPVIADLSSWLADVAGKAGIAWERLFDAPEEKSLRTLRYELDLTSSTIEKLEAPITLGCDLIARRWSRASVRRNAGGQRLRDRAQQLGSRGQRGNSTLATCN